MKSVSAIALSALLLGSVLPASAGGAYDGQWAVQLVTEKGNCDRALSWDVGVSANRIADNGMLVQTSGVIDGQGRVSLLVTQGVDRVSASGKLSGATGAGAWKSPTKSCSGHWRAVKRA